MARLVHGSTDLLQPINLLSNSDFSRSGGYPISGSIPDPYVSTYLAYKITQDFMGASPHVPMNYSISNGSIHFSGGWGNNSTPTSWRIVNHQNILFQANKTYTIVADVESNYPCVMSIADSNSGSYVTYYSKSLLDEGFIRLIKIISYSSDKNFGFSIWVNKTTSTNFDITIKNCAVYKGAYTNPPVYKSLDVQPSNQFLYKGLSNLYSNDNLSFTISANDTNYYEMLSTGGNIFHKTFIKVRKSIFEIDFSYCVPTHSKGQVIYSRCLLNDNIQSILPSFYVCSFSGGIYLCIKLQNNTSAIDVMAYSDVSYTINVDRFYNTLSYSSGLDVFGRHRQGTYTLVKTIPIEYPE